MWRLTRSTHTGCHTGNINNRTLTSFQHMWNGLLHRIECAFDVQTVGTVPKVITNLKELCPFDSGTCAIEVKLNLPLGIYRLSNHGANTLALCYIHINAGSQTAYILGFTRPK